MLTVFLLLVGSGVVLSAPRASSARRRPRPRTEPASTNEGAPRGGVAGEPQAPLPKAEEKTNEENAIPRGDVAAARERLLSSPAIAFCRDPAYQLTTDDHGWCDVIRDVPSPASGATASCPAWRSACARPPVEPSRLLRRRALLRPLPTLPDLTWPLRVLVAGLLLGVLIVVVRLVRDKRGRAPDAHLPANNPDALAPALLAERRQRVETDVARLLARATQSEQAGDFASASRDTYAALLRRLEGLDLWKIEPHLTNGDMLRAVGRPRPTLVPALTDVVRHVEQLEFGQTPPTREAFAQLWQKVQRLLAQELVTGLLWLSATLCLALGVVACDRRDDATRWNESPSGHALWVPFLRAYGFEAHERLRPLRQLAEQGVARALGPAVPDILVIFPTARLEESDWRALATWGAERPRLLVLAGQPEGFPSPFLSDLTVLPMEEALVDMPAHLFGREGHLRLPRAGAFGGTRGAVAVKDERTQRVYGRTFELGRAPGGASQVLVFADDGALANASLLVAENVEVLTEMLRLWGKRVELVTDATSLVSDSPTEAVARSPWGPAMVQLLLLLGLAFVARGAHFGTPRDLPARSRRDFLEHVRAVGALYRRAHAARHAFETLGTYLLERLRSRHGGATGKSMSALAEAVAARTGRPLGEVMGLFVETKPAREGGREKESETLARLAELAALAEEKGDRRERR